MAQRLLLLLLCAAITASPALAQDDLMEKIKHLELQIQELKTLKEQQNISVVKTQQCMKVVARDTYCTCVGSSLPRDVGFEQFVHTVVTSKDALGYAGMTPEQKTTIDSTLDVREKCIEKGFFK